MEIPCKNSKMNIVFASSEIVPFASTGGLGNVCEALPKALARAGDSVACVMPLYRQIDRRRHHLAPCDPELLIYLGSTCYQGRIFSQARDGVTTYFIHCPEFFGRDGIYGTPHRAYTDNFERFLFFQKAVVGLIDQLELKPDVVHCNDWQTALIPMLLKHRMDSRPMHGTEKTLMTIHNLAHQGWAHAGKFHLTQLPPSCYTMKTLEFYGEINCMKGGIVQATAINAVSPTYAREILTPEFGNRLEGVLQERRNDLYGILNGVDYLHWNTETDPYIEEHYSVTRLAGKNVCKRIFQKRHGLAEEQKIPLLGMISRLTHQKGIDLLIDVIEGLIEAGAQLVVLGTGDEHYEHIVRAWAERWPSQVVACIEYSSKQAHRIFSASDLFLMPSEFEPCGQSQICGMRYGAVPIVHNVGGLADTVIDYPKKGSTGFKFHECTAAALMKAIQRALGVYAVPARWEFLMKRAMKKDFPVENMGHEYRRLYKKIID